MTDVPDKTIEAARQVADKLDQRGHAEHAGRLRAAIAHNHSASVLRSALAGGLSGSADSHRSH